MGSQTKGVVASTEYRELSTSQEKLNYLLENTTLYQQEIAQRFNVSKSTICRWKTALVKKDGSWGQGRPRWLNLVDESYLVTMAFERMAKHTPMTSEDLVEEAMRLKREREGLHAVDPPSHNWTSRFIARNPSLKRMTPNFIDPDKHAACTKEAIGDWFTRINNELQMEK